MKIPSLYFQERNFMESLRMMRRWFYEGLTPADAVRQYMEAYKECDNEEEAHRMLMVICGIMGHADEGRAMKALRRLDIRPVPCRSAGETINSVFQTMCPTIHLRMFDDSIRYDALYTSKPRFESSLRICRPMDSCRMAMISPDIYAYRSHKGTLELMSLCDCSQPLLVDEEYFNGEAPLYFTETTHFISPLYCLDVVRKILERILAHIGYPALHINLTAYFTSPQAEILGLDNPDTVEAIEAMGGRLVTRAERKGYFVNSIEAPMAIVDGTENEPEPLDFILCEALTATSEIYCRMPSGLPKGCASVDNIDELIRAVRIFE